MDALDPLLTRKELCRFLSISTSTLDRWIAEGRIPPADSRPGPRSPRWRKSSVEQALCPAAPDGGFR
jgi:excisionase family DNA binding protein